MGDFYKDFNPTVDEKVFEQLIELYFTKSPKQFLPDNLVNVNTKKLTTEIYKETKMVSYSGVKELLTGDAKTVLANLNNDKGFLLVKALAEKYAQEVQPEI